MAEFDVWSEGSIGKLLEEKVTTLNSF